MHHRLQQRRQHVLRTRALAMAAALDQAGSNLASVADIAERCGVSGEIASTLRNYRLLSRTLNDANLDEETLATLSVAIRDNLRLVLRLMEAIRSLTADRTMATGPAILGLT